MRLRFLVPDVTVQPERYILKPKQFQLSFANRTSHLVVGETVMLLCCVESVPCPTLSTAQCPETHTSNNVRRAALQLLHSFRLFSSSSNKLTTTNKKETKTTNPRQEPGVMTNSIL